MIVGREKEGEVMICKRCRRRIRSREEVGKCLEHRGIVCFDCAEQCVEEGHWVDFGIMSSSGKYVLMGRRRG